jgi:streptomycin 6-kinase
MIDVELASWVDHWGLVLTEPVHTDYSQAWFALRGAEHVVLKRGDHDARRREAVALQAYGLGGAPVCEVLAEGPGMLVLRRVLPGDDLRPLASVDDDQATAVVADVIAELHRSGHALPGNPGLPALASIGAAFTAAPHGPAPVPPRLFQAAAELTAQLSVADTSDTVVHGDLHHKNVLRDGWNPDECDWVAIDPHGWWGDPTFDGVAMMLDLHDAHLWSGLTDDQVRQRALRRIAIISERAGLAADRLESWVIAGCVIAELWCWEDHLLVQGWPLRLAEVLLTARR